MTAAVSHHQNFGSTSLYFLNQIYGVLVCLPDLASCFCHMAPSLVKPSWLKAKLKHQLADLTVTSDEKYSYI